MQIEMPRKYALPHTKFVKKGRVRYGYFNTGEKVDGKPVRVALGRTDAPGFGEKHAAALAARTRRQNAPRLLTVPALIAQFERSPDMTSKVSFGTQKTYGVYLRQLAKQFNNAPADQVEQKDIFILLDKMASRPSAAGMMHLVATKLFRWALKRKLISTDPTEGVERPDEESEEYEPWPEDLVEAALADPKVQLAAALLYFTAQRIGDVCRMRWDDRRPDGHHAHGVIDVLQQKTGKELPIPVHERLAEILDQAPRKGDTILTDPKGRKAKDQTIRAWLKDFAEARGYKIVPHGLRKNAVNALLEAGCSTGETSSISGQSLRMVEHYARRRNNTRMSRSAMSKWERSGNGKRDGKLDPETVDL
jgi:integrase